MTVIPILSSNVEEFRLVLTEDAFRRVQEKSPDTYGFGAVEDGMPVGAIAVSCEPPEAEIISLYVIEEVRREGIGTALFTEALEMAMVQEPIEYMYVAGETVTEGEDTLLPFVTALMFDIVDTGKDFTLSVSEAFESEGMKKILSAKEKGECFADLSPKQKKLIYKKELDVPDYLSVDMICEDISFVTLDKDESSIVDCLLFVEDKGQLVLAWTKSGSDNPYGLVSLMARSMKEICKKEQKDRIIHFPVINDASENLLKHIFGAILTEYSKSYWALYRI